MDGKIGTGCERGPRFGRLDADGRPEVDDYHLWHAAIWLPEGREAEVAEFLAEHGIGVYRMWKVTP